MPIYEYKGFFRDGATQRVGPVDRQDGEPERWSHPVSGDQRLEDPTLRDGGEAIEGFAVLADRMVGVDEDVTVEFADRDRGRRCHLR